MIHMTYKQAEDLVLICNGCGEAMRFMGEWPVQWPKIDKTMNIQQAYRWSCTTCRTPHAQHKNGVPVMVAIIGINPVQDSSSRP